MLLNHSTTSFVWMDALRIPSTSLTPSEGSVKQRHELQRLLQLMRALRIPRHLTWLGQDAAAATDASFLALFDQSQGRDVFNACEAGLTDWLLQVGTPSSQGNQRSLPKHLQKPKVLTRTQVVMAGGDIHAGLLQTALSLLEEDFDVWLISDLCFSDQKSDLEATFDRLASNGVELITANMAAAEWAGRPDHPAYSEWLTQTPTAEASA